MKDESLLGTADSGAANVPPSTPIQWVHIAEMFDVPADLVTDAETLDAIAGLRSLPSVTLTGRWEPNEALTDLALSLTFGSRRAPRKTKKAFRKLWMSDRLGLRERQRIHRADLWMERLTAR